MSPSPRRWIRLDVTWSRSEWLITLRPGGRLSWIELLAYVKANGVTGRAKAMTAIAAGRTWGIPPKDVESMMSAAVTDGALELESGDWIVTGWATYQETDPTAAERMRRMREKEQEKESSKDAAPEPVTRNGRNETRNTHNRGRNPSRDRDLDPKALTTTSRAHSRSARWKFCPEEWRPKQGHADLAAELHVDMVAEEAAFRVHEFKDPKSDADKAFYGWIRRTASHFRNGNGNGKRHPKKRRVARDGTILSA